MSESDGLSDALRDALGQVIAEERRAWRVQVAVMRAEANVILRQLTDDVATLSADVRNSRSSSAPADEAGRAPD